MPDSSAVSFDALALLTNGLVVAGTVAVFALLWRPAVRDSSTWSAIATPLASIIGSGFLVVAPLLGYTVGNWALFAMLGIVALAYAVGGAVRYNIRHLEKIAGDERTGKDSRTVFKWLERLAKLVLALAYVVAITFYLELLAAFVLRLFDLEGTAYQKVIATGLIIFIGAFGLLRGLKPLERLEEYSVDAKLAIIAGFLVGLAVVNIEHLVDGSWALNPLPVDWSLETLRKLLGAFLIVQGFETSRDMGNVYGADERITTMR
ncbi:MAG: hypothetical protein P8080_13620, partial [Gammaproteobacteria bacterium]